MAERKITPWEAQLAAMRGAQERSRQYLEEVAKARVQFAARSMDRDDLLEEAEIVTQDRTGAEVRREKRRIAPVGEMTGNEGSYIDFSGRAFVGQYTGLSEDGLGAIIDLGDVPEGWYGNNAGKVHDTWNNRIEARNTKEIRKTSVQSHSVGLPR